jgi:hypothetical protein
MQGAHHVTSIWNISPGDCDNCVVGTRTSGLDLILAVAAAALLFPVLIFIGAATRLAATRREQRFAAMRLVGATPQQVSVISAVESTVAAIAGIAVGFGLFFLLRNPISTIRLTGEQFLPSDLSLNVADVLLVVLGVPVGAVIAARVALRRVRISPLGVVRRVTPKAPRAYRLIPLVAGIWELAYFIGRRPQTSNGQVAAFLPGVLVIMAGLVIAGPWLTMIGARVMARRANRPASLIAARRLADNPQVAFRAVSGLVLGLFVTSVAIGVITTIVANRGSHELGPAERTMLSKQFNGPAGPDAKLVSATVLADLRSTPGVKDVIVVRRNPDDSPESMPGLVSCADLALIPEHGRCPAGATVAQVWSDFSGFRSSAGSTTVWPTAPLTIEQYEQAPVQAIVVDTDGSTSTIEHARTRLEIAYPQGLEPPATNYDFDSDFTSVLYGWKQLANVVILATLPIAGCSLAVSVAGGLSERKRPFSLLRLSGAQLKVLRRVVALESAAPLLVVAVVAIGVGFLASDLFLRAQMEYTLKPPGGDYYVIVLAGLAISMAIIASTLPILERITGPETARND